MPSRMYVRCINAPLKEALLQDRLLSPEQFKEQIGCKDNSMMEVIHEKIVNGKYVDGAFDGLARMFAGFGVCAAITPIYERGNQYHERKILKKLLIGYNSTLPTEREEVIKSVWKQIWTVAITPNDSDTKAFIAQKFDLLSKIMSFQEYKVAMNYGDLCENLFRAHCKGRKDKVFDDDIDNLNITELLLVFVNYGNTVRAYTTSFNHMSNDNGKSTVSSKYLIGVPSINLLTTERLFETFTKVSKILNADIGLGLSQCFLKLHFVLGEVISHISVKNPKNTIFKEDITAQYSECGYAFARAIQDATTVPSRLTKLLSSDDNIQMDFIPNEYKLHAEVLVLQRKIAEMGMVEGDDGFIDVSRLLDDPIGVSKLSCGWCWMMFDYMSLTQYLRGCHGALFDRWHSPLWEFEERKGDSPLHFDTEEQSQEAMGPYGWQIRRAPVHVERSPVVKTLLIWDHFRDHIKQYLQNMERAHEGFLHLNQEEYLYPNKACDAFSDDEDNCVSRVKKTSDSNSAALLERLYLKYLLYKSATIYAPDVAEVMTLRDKIIQKIHHFYKGLFHPKLEAIQHHALKELVFQLEKIVEEKPDLIDTLGAKIEMRMDSGGIFAYIFSVVVEGQEGLVSTTLPTEDIMSIMGSQ